ncbi:MAG TPA: hypothetical protein VL307_01235 [Chitinophagaceae bacterium]|nr:hypothetical protein [Chitinophagaceae bacterium]
MKKNQLLYAFLLLSLYTTIFITACSKSGGNSTPADPCAGVTVTITLAVTATDAGASTGAITATAAGGTGFTYSINSGAFQSSGSFSNLAAGKYTITAKNANGCTGTTSGTVVAKTVSCTGTPGPLFTAVKTIITNNCAVTGCHNGSQAPNYTTDCTIVDYADLIKTRAVDNAGTSQQMPQPPRAPLSQADRDKISAWIVAGKRLTD